MNSEPGSDLLKCYTVVPQHELGPIHPHEVQVIVKPHESFLPEQPRDMIWS
jgi:hypothetical protein